MFANLFRSLRRAKASSRKPERQSFRPAVEGLEGRLLMDTYAWGGPSGDFGNADSWIRTAPPGGVHAVPGPNDIANITSSVTVTSSVSRTVGQLLYSPGGELQITGGTFTVMSGSLIRQMNVKSGATFRMVSGVTRVSDLFVPTLLTPGMSTFEGTVEVSTGATLLMGGKNDFKLDSRINVAAGGKVEFKGASSTRAAVITFRDGSAISAAGEVSFGSYQTSTIAGSYNVTGFTSIMGGTVAFNTDAVSRGVTLGGSGILTGNGNFTSTHWFDWINGGIMEGSGTTISQGHLHLMGNSLILRRDLISKRTAEWDGGNIQLDGNFTNEGEFRAMANANFTKEWVAVGPNRTLKYGPKEFKNKGSFIRGAYTTGPARVTAFQEGAFFRHEGQTVNVEKGTLKLSDSTITKPIVVASGATLEFSSGHLSSTAVDNSPLKGIHNLAGTATFTGAGVVKVSGTAMVYVMATITGSNFEVAGGELHCVSGTLNLTGNYTQTGGRLALRAVNQVQVAVAGRVRLGGRLEVVGNGGAGPLEVMSFGSRDAGSNFASVYSDVTGGIYYTAYCTANRVVIRP